LTRETFDAWQTDGQTTVADRIQRQVDSILREHGPEPMDPSLSKEIDRIVAAARRELTDT
jgi:trimethylamine:corrinoid methyltransferase-like protein